MAAAVPVAVGGTLAAGPGPGPDEGTLGGVGGHWVAAVVVVAGGAGAHVGSLGGRGGDRVAVGRVGAVGRAVLRVSVDGAGRLPVDGAPVARQLVAVVIAVVVAAGVKAVVLVHGRVDEVVVRSVVDLSLLPGVLVVDQIPLVAESLLLATVVEVLAQGGDGAEQEDQLEERGKVIT